MKEISRRAMNSESEGMACGPAGVYAIDAEIVVNDEGKTVYLHTQWVDEASDMILFEATTESIYYQMVKMNADEAAFDEAVDEMNRIRSEKDLSKNEGIDISERYAEQYQQLIQMMQEILDQDEKGFNLKTLSYDDEDEDYEDEEDEDWDDEE